MPRGIIPNSLDEFAEFTQVHRHRHPFVLSKRVRVPKRKRQKFIARAKLDQRVIDFDISKSASYKEKRKEKRKRKKQEHGIYTLVHASP
jgi:hypothetical protein